MKYNEPNLNTIEGSNCYYKEMNKQEQPLYYDLITELIEGIEIMENTNQTDETDSNYRQLSFGNF